MAPTVASTGGGEVSRVELILFTVWSAVIVLFLQWSGSCTNSSGFSVHFRSRLYSGVVVLVVMADAVVAVSATTNDGSCLKA